MLGRKEISGAGGRPAVPTASRPQPPLTQSSPGCLPLLLIGGVFRGQSVEVRPRVAISKRNSSTRRRSGQGRPVCRVLQVVTSPQSSRTRSDALDLSSGATVQGQQLRKSPCFYHLCYFRCVQSPRDTLRVQDFFFVPQLLKRERRNHFLGNVHLSLDVQRS